MIAQDLFVGAVAVTVGIFVGVSAIAQSRWYSRFWLSRLLDQKLGERWARGAGLLIGLLLALLGVLILMGYFSPNPGNARRGEFAPIDHGSSSADRWRTDFERFTLVPA